MSDLSKNQDGAERAYAVDPSVTNWKAVTEARAALERDTTRQAALARIAADEATAAKEAVRQKLRDELAALAPTLSAASFLAAVKEERTVVAAARAALSEAHASIASKLADYQAARERASVIAREFGNTDGIGEPLNASKVTSIVLFGACAVPDTIEFRALLGKMLPTDHADALGLAYSGMLAGVSPQLILQGDPQAFCRAAVNDKLFGSTELPAMLRKAEADSQDAGRIGSARYAAVRDGRRDPSVTEGTLRVLADSAEEHMRTAIAAERN